MPESVPPYTLQLDPTAVRVILAILRLGQGTLSSPDMHVEHGLVQITLPHRAITAAIGLILGIRKISEATVAVSADPLGTQKRLEELMAVVPPLADTMAEYLCKHTTLGVDDAAN